MILETLADQARTMYKGRTANRPTTELEVLNIKHRGSHCVILEVQTQVEEAVSSKAPGALKRLEKGA